MKSHLFPSFIAVLGGVLIACQIVVNANLGRLIGSIPAAGAVSAIITCTALLAVVCFAGSPLQAFRGFANAPYWMPIAGGLLGAAIMGAVLWSTPRVGAGGVVVLLIAGQLLFGAIADHFGLFGLRVQRLDMIRVAGFLAVAAGAWMASTR